MSKVFIIPFHVKALDNSIMPKELSGAYVSCFVSTTNYVDAVKKALTKLATDGLHPEEILEPISEIKLSSWEEYLKTTWPHNIKLLPNREEFEQSMKSGYVIYSPFASYNS
jgi:hypothetical protein